jgi:hypothetical protein
MLRGGGVTSANCCSTIVADQTTPAGHVYDPATI